MRESEHDVAHACCEVAVKAGAKTPFPLFTSRQQPRGNTSLYMPTNVGADVGDDVTGAAVLGAAVGDGVTRAGVTGAVVGAAVVGRGVTGAVDAPVDIGDAVTGAPVARHKLEN